MKKIIFGILVFVVCVFKVDAKEVYYSEYGDFSDYSLERIESSELVNVEVERRYKFYEEKIVGEYRSFLDDNSNYMFYDVNKIKNTEYSDFSILKPLDVPNRIVESKIFYKVESPKPINRISFMNTLNGSLKLNEVEIYYLGEKLEYDLILDSADNDLNIYPLGTITLDLKEYYDLQKITIKIKGIDFNNLDGITVLASVPSENKLYDIFYFHYLIENNESKDIVINSGEWRLSNAEYYDEEVLNYKPEDEPLSKISQFTMYRYQDPLYYFYNIEKNYIEDYFKDYTNLTKDENLYQDYYRYQIRDKIEVEEDLTITNYNQKLSDFVNSTVDYEILTNLDINKNGTYQVEYRTPFISLKKEVLVNIKENEVNNDEKIFDDLNSEISNLKNQNNQLNFKLEEVQEANHKLNLELEQVNNNYDNLLIDFKNLKQKYQNLSVLYSNNENCKIELEEALIKIDDNKEKINLIKQANKYLENSLLKIDNKGLISIKKDSLWWIILVLVILFLLLLIFLKKLSDKNKF